MYTKQRSRHNSCHVQPPETVIILSASRRCLWIRSRKLLLSGVVVVVVVFTLKTFLTSIQYPSLSYSSRQRNEFPWSQANATNNSEPELRAIREDSTETQSPTYQNFQGKELLFRCSVQDTTCTVPQTTSTAVQRCLCYRCQSFKCSMQFKLVH